MASNTLPQSPVQNFPLEQFRELCHQRDARAYQAVGGAQAALAYLNMGEIEMARTALVNTLDSYQQANRAIDRFRKEHYVDATA